MADSLLDGQCVLSTEYSASAALEAVQMSSAAEGFSEITGECADIGALAACHPDHGSWQSESRVVGYIDSAGRI